MSTSKMDRELAIHDANCETVSAVHKRLKSFLASSAEIKAICASIPPGYIIALPLLAERDGLARDARAADLAYFDAIAGDDLAEDDEIDATGLTAGCVLDMVRHALKVKAAEQAASRAKRIAA